MKKFLIGLAIALVIIVVVIIFLPQSAKDYANYFGIQKTEPLKYSYIQQCRDAIVITDIEGTDPMTYGDILNENAEYEYWTYDETVNADGTVSRTITGNGTRVTLAYGEDGDAGMLQRAKVKFLFTLDGKGGYDLSVYVNDSLLKENDRNLLLQKMCQLAKE